MKRNKQGYRIANAAAAALVALSLTVYGGSTAQAQNTQNVTLTGIVAKNPVAGVFVIRADNGWTYRVDSNGVLPRDLTIGDRVRTYGDWDNGLLEAGNVRVLRHGRPTDGYHVRPNRSISGVVVENRSDNDFVLRANNGWTYLVRAIWGEPTILSVGDRLRAYGSWRDGILEATNLHFTYNGSVLRDAPDSDVANSSSGTTLRGISRTGTVVENRAGNEFTMRTAQGVTYRVRVLRGESSTLSAGDRVRVFGDLRGNFIDAVNVRIAYQAEVRDPDPYNESRYDYSRYRENRTITGTVTSNPSGNRFTLRASNGYTYAVRDLSGEPRTLTAGDRVRVYGAWRDGLIEAANVRVLRQGTNPKTWSTHTWVGIVTENQAGDRFVFRLPNGISYRVLAVWGEPADLSVGDRVRAYGEWRNGMLHASNVRVLRQG